MPRSQCLNETGFSRVNINLSEFDEREATSERYGDVSFDLLDEAIKVLMEPISSQHKDPEPKNMEQIEHQKDSTDKPYVGIHIVKSNQDENEKIREEQKR